MYTTVEEVQKRLGVTFTQEEEDIMTYFLEDFTVFLDSELVRAGLTGTSAPSAPVLNLISARRGVSYYLQGDLIPGVSSLSQTMEGMSQSFSVSGSGVAVDFWLTKQEKRLLGISGASAIINIPIELESDCESGYPLPLPGSGA